MKTPLVPSPFNYMQERYRNDPWALLVGCILFNMVRGSRAQLVHEEFLRFWPDAATLSEDIDDENRCTPTVLALERLFEPLGLRARRRKAIIAMTEDYLRLRPDLNRLIKIEDLHGCGKYASDSFEIFVRGNLVEDVADKELKKYVEWASALSQSESAASAMVANIPTNE